MEAIWIIFGIVAVVINAINKSAKKAAADSKGSQTKTAAKQVTASVKPQKEKSTASTHKAQPVEGEGTSVLMKPTEYKVMAHRLNTIPARETYMGSLGGTSAEGDDLCDPSLGHADNPLPVSETVSSDSVYAHQIRSSELVDFSSQGVIRAVIMSEILKRPSERRTI